MADDYKEAQAALRELSKLLRRRERAGKAKRSVAADEELLRTGQAMVDAVRRYRESGTKDVEAEPKPDTTKVKRRRRT
jgi:hypothetical protein